MDLSSPRTHTIYKITNTVSGKIYIGQTRRSLEKRFLYHCYASRYSKTVLGRAISGYGSEVFTIEEVARLIDANQEEVNKLETEMIARFDSLFPKGYNMIAEGSAPPSCFGRVNDEKTLKKMSESAFRSWSQDAERRKQQSERMKARHADPEQAKKMYEEWSKKNKGRVVNSKALERMLEYRKANPQTKEQIEYRQARLREVMDSPEFRQARSEQGVRLWGHKRKKYLITDPNGNQYEVLGLNQFCKQHNLDTSSMAKIARGKLKAYKKWHCICVG